MKKILCFAFLICTAHIYSQKDYSIASIPKELTEKHDFNGVLLFIILTSCLIMTWSLMRHKKNSENPAETSDLLASSEDQDLELDNFEEEL